MSNISNLTTKIQMEAEAMKDSIIATASEEKEKIISKKNADAKVLVYDMIERAKAEAKSTKERIISGAELKARNEKLGAKQTIIKEVFEKSVSELCKLDKVQYLTFIKKGILSFDIKGDENLILSDEGIKLVNNDIIEEINKELVSKGKKGNLTLISKPGEFRGGFILEKNGIEINNTFETLVDSLKEELEFEVAKELFN